VAEVIKNVFFFRHVNILDASMLQHNKIIHLGVNKSNKTDAKLKSREMGVYSSWGTQG
jgi:ABC-type enterochelin transport system permease subunit